MFPLHRWEAQVLFLILFGTWAVMQWYDKLPSPHTIQDLFTVLNSRSGNIVMLAVASVYFFTQSLRLFYVLMDYSRDGKIGQDNAFALMALQFVTSTAFGGAFGALLKTMTGESSKSRITDTPQRRSSKDES